MKFSLTTHSIDYESDMNRNVYRRWNIRAQDLAAQFSRVFIDEHFVASHCLSIHQMKPRRRSLSEQLQILNGETRPTMRNPTKGNESNLLNIACRKVNGTNTGAIAVPDLRRLPVDKRDILCQHITVYSHKDLLLRQINIKKFLD